MSKTKPASLNSLMKHLRASGVAISGPSQKRKLKNIGYYHGYKGYRFAGKAANKLPVTEFNQIALLHDFDMDLKTLFYPKVMLVETALKNYTLEAVVSDAESEAFEDVWRHSLTDYRSHQGGSYGRAWERRQRLRSVMDGLIVQYHTSRDVIRHFRDSDRDIPIWALFEVMTLGSFGVFYECLDARVKGAVVADLGLPSNYEPERVLKAIVYTLKDFRNAVAHNAPVYDVRFKTGKVSGSIGELVSADAGIAEVDFNDVTDYMVLLAYLMTKMRFPKREVMRFVGQYAKTLERYRSLLPFDIYSKVIKTTARSKVEATMAFVKGI